jgi:PAS domain S-box-containing protein
MEHNEQQPDVNFNIPIGLPKAILDNLGYAIITCNAQGIIITFNHAAETMLGYSADEVIGKYTPELFHDKKEIEQRILFLYNTYHVSLQPGFEVFTYEPHEHKKQNQEWTYIRKDGSRILVSLKINTINDNAGNVLGFIGIASDITEIRLKQEEQQRKELYLKSIVSILQHNTLNLSEFLDLALAEAIKLTNSKFGYIYYYSEEKQQFTLNTWSKEVMDECKVVNPQTLYHLEKTGIWGEAVRQRKPIIVNDFEAENLLKKGYPSGHVHLSRFMTIPIFKADQIVAVVGLANKEKEYTQQDLDQLSLLMEAAWKIIDNLKVNQDIKESQLQLKNIIDKSPIGIITVSMPDFRIINVNDKWKEYFGYSSQEVYDAQSWFNHAYPDDTYREYVEQKWESHLNEHAVTGIFQPIEVEVTCKNRTVRNVQISASFTGDVAIISFVDFSTLKKVEKELKITEQKYSNIYNMVPEMVGVTRLADGKLLEGNQMLTTISGFTPEEYIGRTSFELNWWIDTHEREVIKNAIEEKGEITNFEIRMRIKNGNILTCLFSARALEFEGEECLLFVSHDITEIKKIQEALQQRVLALTRPINDAEGIQFTDLFNVDDLQKIQDIFAEATGVASIITTPDGTPITKPSNFCKLCKIIRSTPKGYANCCHSDAILGMQNPGGSTVLPCLSGGLWDAGASITLGGRHMANWLIGQVKNEAQDESVLINYAVEIGADMEEYKKALAEVTIMSKAQFKKVSQALFVLTNELSLKAYQNVQQARFIAEHKEIEEAIRKSEARLQKAQIVGRIGYSEQIIGENKVWVSAQGMSIFGYPAHDGYLSVDEIAACMFDFEGFRLLFRDLIERGKRYDVELHIKPANGEPLRWIHTVSEIEKDEAGKPYKVIGIFQDITDRKIAEEEIRRLNADLEQRVNERTVQLEQANRDLESFAYSVSHDLRAPLRHVDGFVKLLYSTIEQPTSIQSNHYSKISYASKRMSSMIDDLLTFSRLGRKDMNINAVNLNSILDDILEQYKPDMANRNIEWKIEAFPEIWGDKNLLRIAFENLISNAIKYTSTREKAIIQIGVMRKQKTEIEIFIKDNGVGFSMEYAQKLFGVFQRLHSNEEFEGTGIGLANVKQIIVRHKGSIRADSIENEGATFYVTLPLHNS